MRSAIAPASRTIRAICRDARRASRRPVCSTTCRRMRLMVIDESHQTIPQLGAMYKGDRSRKETLVEYGFRLPSALDNRPLRFEEFEHLAPQAIYVSATPAHYEKRVSAQVIEQVVRPDRPDRSGGGDPSGARPGGRSCCRRSASRAQANERVLVTTLTKRMAEDLTEYLSEHGVQGALPARRYRDGGALGNHSRPALGEIRRDRRHQSAARRLGHAGSLLGRHPRCRQGGFLALGRFA